MVVAELADVLRVHLGVVAEQPVPVHRGTVGLGDLVVARVGADVGHRRLRDVAGEAGVVDASRAACLGRQAVGPEVERPGAGGLTVRVDVAGNIDGAGHLAHVLDRMAAGEVVRRVADRLHVGDRVVRGIAVDHPVARRGVAELGKGVVANVQHSLAQVPGAGDSEVPGHVEVRSPDPCRLQLGEDPLHVGASLLDHRICGRDLVAVEAEARRRRDRLALRVPEVAHRDDVAVAVEQVAAPVDHQIGLIRARCGRVELGPDQLSFSGGGIDHDDRRVRIEVAGHLGDRHRVGIGERLGGVQPRNVGDHGRSRAETVAGIDLRRVDVDVVVVDRRRVGSQGQSLSGVGPRVGGRVVVVRIGEEALPRLGRRDRIAFGGVRQIDAYRLRPIAQLRVASHRLRRLRRLSPGAPAAQAGDDVELGRQAALDNRAALLVEQDPGRSALARTDPECFRVGDARPLATLLHRGRELDAGPTAAGVDRHLERMGGGERALA